MQRRVLVQVPFCGLGLGCGCHSLCTSLRTLNLPEPSTPPPSPQRVRYIRAWLWALPERAELMGRWVALGVDSVMWTRLMVRVRCSGSAFLDVHALWWGSENCC